MTGKNLPTGTVTFLFTDIEGSTPLWEQEPAQMRVALERHHAILHAAIAAHDGQVYKIVGDAFQAAFEVASQAVRAALRAQRGLAAEAWPTRAPLRVRMGVHVGHAIAQDGDYATTHTLNRVARIMSAGHGGQILISEAVADVIRDELPEGVGLSDMGQHHMKGLTQREHLFQVVVPDLPAHFPPLNTLDLPADNLPTQLTPFIGRTAEIAEVKRLLSQARLTTLTGSGGCGKTRLSIQVAREVQAEFPHGVWLVELATLADAALVGQTVAAVLGLRDDGGRPPAELLADFLRSRTLLLVMDNCEHVIDACARLCEALLHACPRLRILASSREALGLAGEAAYRVPSLPVPDPGHLPPLEVLAGLDAVRLFVERAASARPGFTLSAQNAAVVVQICKRLDGIPLAIELAASRVKMLSAEQIAARLDDRFRLLTGGSRTALPRQQTLRATIDWSYSLLAEPEKIVFRRLAVFVGGWTLEAAEQVCSGSGLEPFDLLDLLTRLVDKSLVFAEEAAGETRYHRLETIRQYSREKFLETDEVEATRDRHLEYYVRFTEAAEKQMAGARRAEWTQRLEAEQDNLRAAMEWGLNQRPECALRTAASLPIFWTAGGYSDEGLRWIQQGLEHARTTGQTTTALRAKALSGLATLYISLGDNASGKRQAEESVGLYRQSQDRGGLAQALIFLALAQEYLGERVQAEAALQESLTLARSEGNRYAAATALTNLARVTADLSGDLEAAQRYAEEAWRVSRDAGLEYSGAVALETIGSIAAHRQDYRAARARFEEAQAAYQRLNANFNVILVKSALAHLERQLGQWPRALQYYRETLVAFRDVGQSGAVAHQLECIGFIAAAQDQPERALRLLAAAEALREQRGTPMRPDEQITYQQDLRIIRERLDPAVQASAWAEGRAMGMERAIQYALELKSDASNPPGYDPAG